MLRKNSKDRLFNSREWKKKSEHRAISQCVYSSSVWKLFFLIFRFFMCKNRQKKWRLVRNWGKNLVAWPWIWEILWFFTLRREIPRKFPRNIQKFQWKCDQNVEKLILLPRNHARAEESVLNSFKIAVKAFLNGLKWPLGAKLPLGNQNFL